MFYNLDEKMFIVIFRFAWKVSQKSVSFFKDYYFSSLKQYLKHPNWKIDKSPYSIFLNKSYISNDILSQGCQIIIKKSLKNISGVDFNDFGEFVWKKSYLKFSQVFRKWYKVAKSAIQ